MINWLIRKLKEHPHCVLCGACMKKKGEICEVCVKDLMKGGESLKRFSPYKENKDVPASGK